MKTIIVVQPLATLIAYGVKKDLPIEYSSLIGYVDYIGNKVDMILIASSNTKPDFVSLSQDIKEEYLHYKDIKNLPDYEKLPINKFIGIAKIEKDNIMDVMTLPTPQKLPGSVKPHTTFFEFEPISNQVIFQALIEFEKKKPYKNEALYSNTNKQIEENNKLDDKSPTKDRNNKTDVRWGLIIAVILGGVLLGLLLGFYGDKIIWGLLGILFIISVIFRYFR